MTSTFFSLLYFTPLFKTLSSLSDPLGNPTVYNNDIWIYYDEDNLYVDWEAQIDSSFIKGTYGPRDTDCKSERLCLQLITNYSEKFAYMFYAYPMGILYDGIRNSDLKVVLNWDSHYKYITEITDSLWRVHYIIPHKDLRITGYAPYQWKMQFLRYTPDLKPNDEFGYPEVDYRDPAEVYFDCFMPIVVNKEINRSHNYRLSTYFKREYDVLTKKQSFDPDNIGANIEYKPAGTLSLKAAFNPDFSEVPIDDERDVSNMRYAQYLDENRFLFTEDIDAFGLDYDLLYTRAIAQPRYAFKMTGNSEHFTYAVLNAMDKKDSQNGYVINSEDIYTVAALRPHTTNASMQMDILNRANKDEHRNAWTFYANPKYNIVTGQTLSSEMIYTYNKLPDNTWKKGTSISSNYFGNFKDLTVRSTIKRSTAEYAPAIGSPGSDKDNDFFLLSSSAIYLKQVQNLCVMNYSLRAGYSYTKAYSESDLIQHYYVFTGNVNLQSDFGYTISSSRNEEAYLQKLYREYSNEVRINYSKYRAILPYLSFIYCKNLNYSDTKLHHLTATTLSLSGEIATQLQYSCVVMHREWLDMPAFTVNTGDNAYNLANVDIKIMPNKFVFITSGLRFNDLETGRYEDTGSFVKRKKIHVGTYSTLRYDCLTNWHIYLGYRYLVEEIYNEYQELGKTVWFKVKADL